MHKFGYNCTTPYNYRTNALSLICSIDILLTMATVNFLYRSTKNEASLNIRLLYRINNMSFEDGHKDFVLGAKTQLKVSKHYWDKQQSLKRVKDIDIANKQTEINTELNKIENHVIAAFDNTPTESIDKNWLKAVVGSYYNPLQKTSQRIAPDLISFIDFYNDERKHDVSIKSIRKFNVIKHKMERMQEHRGETIMINDIGEDFKKEFVRYYRSEKYSQNTMQRELGIIKTFCKHAKRLGLETHPQLDDLKLKMEKGIAMYLTFDELKQIEDAESLPEYLDNARDWLIISCYTGQRISDFMRFTSEMIRIEKGKSLLEFKQQKTQKLMTIPLHQKVLEILDKRNGQFPRPISDQRYNNYIKDVCKLAGVNKKITGKKQVDVNLDGNTSKFRSVTGMFEKWELVTSHIGRRSFATNFYGQIPTNYLIYVTGHSSESLFLNYVGKSNKDKAMELFKYF